MNVSDSNSSETSKLRRTLSWALKPSPKTPCKAAAQRSPVYAAANALVRSSSLSQWRPRPSLPHQAASAPATIRARHELADAKMFECRVPEFPEKASETHPTPPGSSDLLASFGQHRRNDAVCALLEGDIFTAQRFLQQALDFSPTSLPIWDLMLRCVDILEADQQFALALVGVCALAHALEKAAPLVDTPTWNRLVDRFDVVRHADSKKLRQHDDLEAIRSVRKICEVDLLLRYAGDAMAQGAWDKAAQYAFDAFQRDPYSPQAFFILSRHENSAVDVTLYEDAFRI